MIPWLAFVIYCIFMVLACSGRTAAKAIRWGAIGLVVLWLL